MKKTTAMMAAFLLGGASMAMAAKDSTATFKVSGNCGMCKTRIEKTAKAAGATKAVWGVDSQILTVSFNPKKTNVGKIQKKVAAVGHDTGKYKATEAVYDALPGCCQYDREEAAN